MRPTDPVVTLKGFASSETDKAVLFEVIQIGEGDAATPVDPVKKEWFPFSQVKRIVRLPKGSQEMDTLVVSQWIAERKELV
jgi:hypothetical protein